MIFKEIGECIAKVLKEINYFINHSIAQDFYHEALEAIFELIQGATDKDYINIFINNGLIDVIQ